MNTKILIVGQAPPAVKQSLPYDTTMLYDWFKELGIGKRQALDMFDFDAVYDQFTGFANKGGHLKPTEVQMNEYWSRSLEEKVNSAPSVLVLGACAKDFLKSKDISTSMEFIIHPSKRNYSLYQKNKYEILEKITNLIIKSNP